VAGIGGVGVDRAFEGGGAGVGVWGGGGGVVVGGRESAGGDADGAGGSCVSGDGGAVAGGVAGVHADVGGVCGGFGAVRGIRDVVREGDARREGFGEAFVRRGVWVGVVVFFRRVGEQSFVREDRAADGGSGWGFAGEVGVGGGFDEFAGGVCGVHFDVDRDAVEFD